MENWKGKFAVVTGVSEGIGRAIGIDLIKSGIKVIGISRNEKKIKEFAREFKEDQFFGYSCDVSDFESVKRTFELIREKFGSISILVNNAGIAWKGTILSDDQSMDEKLTSIINTNFTGLINVTRQSFQLIEKSHHYGMIININSISGHLVPFLPKGQNLNVYYGTKHAVTATTEVLRQELFHMKNEKVRVSSISPGNVSTDFYNKAKFLRNGIKIEERLKVLSPSDVSNAVLYLLSTPTHVNITEMIIRPTCESF